MAEERASSVQIPIEWHVPEGLISRYANNIIVQHTQHEFVISFFESRPPLIVGSPEEQAAQLEKMTSIKFECVARIIVAPDQMAEFLHVLQRNFETYLSKTKDLEQDT